MKKGMNVWSLPETLSLEQQFSVTSKAGFDSIELNVTEENMHMNTIVTDELGLSEKKDLVLDTPREKLDKIRALTRKYNLTIESLSTTLHWKYPLTSENSEVQAKGILVAKKMIDYCAYFGGKTVLIVPGLVTANQGYDQCYALAKKNLKLLGEYAEVKKIEIGIENVWNKFLLSPLEFRKLIDEIDNEYVGAYFDIGNVLQFGYPEQWIDILGTRIKKVHVKDFKTNIGSIQGFTSLLQGDVNWNRCVHSLKKIGYEGPLTCELEPYKVNGEQLAVDTSAALDYIIKL